MSTAFGHILLTDAQRYQTLFQVPAHSAAFSPHTIHTPVAKSRHIPWTVWVSHPITGELIHTNYKTQKSPVSVFTAFEAWFCPHKHDSVRRFRCRLARPYLLSHWFWWDSKCPLSTVHSKIALLLMVTKQNHSTKAWAWSKHFPHSPRIGRESSCWILTSPSSRILGSAGRSC
jgi:hypothetical protein